MLGVSTEAWTAIITALGFLATTIGLWYTARQLHVTRKSIGHQFIFEVFRLIQDYNDVHVSMQEGTWPNANPTPDQRNRCGRYMGLIQSVQMLLNDGIIDLNVVDHLYSHRIAVLANNSYVQQVMLSDPLQWQFLSDLCKSLKGLPIYEHAHQSIEAKRKTARVAAAGASSSST